MSSDGLTIAAIGESVQITSTYGGDETSISIDCVDEKSASKLKEVVANALIKHAVDTICVQ